MPLRLESGAPVDHGGSWPWAVASTNKRLISAVGRVLASKSDAPPGHGFGAHIHALVKVRDKQGRTALEASTEGPRKAIYLYLLFCGRYELTIGAPEHRSATSVVLRALDRGEKTDYGKVFDDADKDGSGTLERKELAPVAASIGLDAELFLRAEDKSIDRSSFVGICKQQLGDGQRSVVIKLMQEKEQWERERDARAKNELVSRFIVQQLPGLPSDDEIAAAVIARGGGLRAIAQQYLPEGISLGTRAIIMDAADRNLHQIYQQERPNVNTVRVCLEQVFEAVAHLHAKGLMHGDLKLLNVVRFRRDNRLRLIDFDAAAKIVPVGGEGESYAGAKFSSSVLPPEMFHELKQGEEEALEIYWQGESKELQAKVAPKLHRRSGASFVVSSFRTTAGEPVIDNLPYPLVEASAKIDVWSLGALAYMLLAGEPLVPSTRDDDCASGAAMRVLHAWGTQQGVVLERLEKVDDPAARDLVDKLLRREPSARLSVKGALEHPFFHPKSGDTEIVESLRRMDLKIDQVGSKIDQVHLKIDQVLLKLAVQFEVLGTLLRGVDTIAPKLICFLPAAVFSKGSGMRAKLKALTPKNWFKQTVRVFFFDPIRMSLAPTNAGEGFELTFPKEWLVKAMPYVKLGLATLKFAYVAGRLAGFPVPDVASVVGDWIDGQLGALDKLACEAKTWLSEQTNDPAFAEKLLGMLDDNARKAVAKEIDGIKPLGGDALGDKLTVPLKKSFDELDALLGPKYGKWKEKCGLVLAGPSEKDGRSEYVLEADKDAFMEMGAALLSSSEELLPLPSPAAAGGAASAVQSTPRKTVSFLRRKR
ncbi:hypothetical protein EMIHUDRAFT_247174 [Emiliania huxleyi CCMP1516]|uniref:Calmodulin n=2 Tax=Emiliania huxleyi TaxID=2903 RepID=A0A0D3IP38_EMIH1|nr:hypothetical protein EMIHUDRAFT_247174 [Emiliania huxleyi CCMP1516]EOD13023.1 hypothetical protein EMIHUDRAFT_247174 [Emiliania huxleyi CCMP1516]|eukprot:XP_005765452.1 hypothetical protein EMIHUDRAFT_247174 [Emiliania huxleyi CCMP1516]